MISVPGKLTDSTGGAASQTLDDTTASVKDDMAAVAAKINQIVDCIDQIVKTLTQGGVEGG